MKLIGIYTIDEPYVHLVEILFDDPPRDIDVGEITQEIAGQSPGSWQTPWDEKYLDETGHNIIGDSFEIPGTDGKTRLLFFFHYLDVTKPLLTPEGDLALAKPTALPDRLKDKVKYEAPD